MKPSRKQVPVTRLPERIGQIETRQQAYRAVNVGLIDLYWSIGERISRRIASDGWGKSTIASLAACIRRRDPNARGFSAQNLWRMRQFYEAWRGETKLSPLVRDWLLG